MYQHDCVMYHGAEDRLRSAYPSHAANDVEKRLSGVVWAVGGSIEEVYTNEC